MCQRGQVADELLAQGEVERSERGKACQRGQVTAELLAHGDVERLERGEVGQRGNVAAELAAPGEFERLERSQSCQREVIDRLRALLKRRQLDSRPLLLSELVDEVVMLTRADSATRHVDVEIDVPRDLPPVRGDRVHLQQVLFNLLLNGMDALAGVADGERLLTVRARAAGNGFVQVAVGDNGHGIPNDKLGRLFEPFFTTKLQGMGLGLPISRTIVEAHGGKIWAENNIGGGATFRFTLPVVEGGVA